ncbi:MAG: CYTH domain-containing protein [Bacteroidales bacterium]
MLEIERKFLVTGEFRVYSTDFKTIKQGYLSSVPERSVRIRVKGKRGFITIKGASGTGGISRFEWEREISASDAEELLKLCEPGIIEKNRYEVVAGSHVYEVDEFLGDNIGLIIAEIELKNEDEDFEKPEWLGKEVTGDVRYYNTWLSEHPFNKW